MNKKGSKQGKISRVVKAPIRALCRARDYYIRRMTDCAGTTNLSNVRATGPLHGLPKSFSVASSRSSNVDEDLRELIRAASTKSLGNKIEIDIREQQQLLRQSATESKGVPRSFSVAIGRIDEDTPCDFEEDMKVYPDLLYPRSKSYAVTKRSTRAMS